MFWIIILVLLVLKSETTVNLAKQEKEAARLRNKTELEQLKSIQDAEIEHKTAWNQSAPKNLKTVWRLSAQIRSKA